MSDDDLITLIDGDEPGVDTRPVWSIVVIDDDPEVHAATTLALRRVSLLGRPLQLLHFHSAAEARERLPALPEPAAILLDVVMETASAGLDLVAFIRGQCRLDATRIILRTGQPGQAPELEVFERYDINDYRTKSELTRTRLITAISGAVRSYDQIRTIAENRRGLELIVRSAPDLLQQQALSTFAEGVLTQLTSLLRVPLDGIVCAQRGSPLDEDDRRLFVVGAAGRLANTVMQPLDQLQPATLAEQIRLGFERRQHQFSTFTTVLYLSAGGSDAAVYIASGDSLEQVDRQLVEVFAANIAACYSNLRRFEDMNTIAYRDLLSGLGNRAQLLRDIEARLAQPRVLALLDLRQFAEINDGLGQDVGNQLLVALGRRLRDELGARCALARIGADVFGVLGDDAEVNPERLFDLLAAPVQAGDHLLPLRAKLGLYRLDGSAESAIDVLKRAGIALNRAKREAGGQAAVYFESAMEQVTRNRLEIIHHLHQDFARGKLQVWFQPQIEVASGKVAGIEALIRWPGEQGFVQPPNVFIPLAEHSGLIVELGYFVLERSVAALHSLQARTNGPRRVSVNVSAAQFREPDFLQRVEQIIRNGRLPMHAVELEITESIAMDEPEAVHATLRALRGLGVRVALDDFGTGFSSLSQLRRLPIDVIKIDQSFVRDIDADRGEVFIETIIALAAKLRVETIAEGVESDAQFEFLRRKGCAVVQGYRFARPMPLDALNRWLDEAG